MRKESHQEDGVSYEITVAESAGVFTATWSCQQYRCGGRVLSSFEFNGQALDQAKLHLSAEHHLPIHKLAGI
jgi:hypothetical protein